MYHASVGTCLLASGAGQLLADEVVSSLDNPGTVSWPMGDDLNSVREVLDNNGNSLAHLVYDSFGNLAVGTNPLGLGFTGRPLDSDTGLQNNLNRWYDARIGRWLSEDPLTADVNLYRYCGNMPLSQVDPLGLWGADVHQDLTKQLAIWAGIACPLEVGETAFSPDTGPYGPGNAIKEAIRLYTLSLVKPDPERTNLRNQAATLLQTMMSYHFPRENGQVVPGGAAAMAMVNEGITKCDFKKFAEGLHPLEDSWSHAGRPLSPIIGGHPAGAIVLPDFIGTIISGIKNGNLDLQTINIQLSPILSALSTSTDKVSNRNKSVREMAMAVYDKLVEFRNTCGNCMCPRTKVPVKGNLPPKDRNWVWSQLWQMYPQQEDKIK